jgi:hypothetical protein
MTMDDECGAFDGMLGRRDGSARRNPVSKPLCPPQTTHELSRARIGTVALGRRRLTARATARP